MKQVYLTKTLLKFKEYEVFCVIASHEAYGKHTNMPGIFLRTAHAYSCILPTYFQEGKVIHKSHIVGRVI